MLSVLKLARVIVIEMKKEKKEKKKVRNWHLTECLKLVSLENGN